MEENSIEEDIKIVENYLANSAINETDSDFFKNGEWETVDLKIPKSMQHILSDYKRVLKENEELHKEINERIKLKIENEKIVDKQFLPIQEIKDLIEELKKTNFNDYTREQDGNEVKMEILYEINKLIERRK